MLCSKIIHHHGDSNSRGRKCARENKKYKKNRVGRVHLQDNVKFYLRRNVTKRRQCLFELQDGTMVELLTYEIPELGALFHEHVQKNAAMRNVPDHHICICLADKNNCPIEWTMWPENEPRLSTSEPCNDAI